MWLDYTPGSTQKCERTVNTQTCYYLIKGTILNLLKESTSIATLQIQELLLLLNLMMGSNLIAIHRIMTTDPSADLRRAMGTGGKSFQGVMWEKFEMIEGRENLLYDAD